MSRRFRQLVLSLPVAAVCFGLTLLTLPGVPASVAGWGDVFEFVAAAPARWLLPAAGWLGFAALAVYLWRKAHPDEARSEASSNAPRPRYNGFRTTVRPSDQPMPAPAPSVPELLGVIGTGSSDALKSALERELVEGRALSNAVGFLAPIGLGGQTTAANVSEWEKRVAHLLNKAERWELADYFLAAVPKPAPTPLIGASVSLIGALGDPELERHMDFRLTQLNTIIKRKL